VPPAELSGIVVKNGGGKHSQVNNAKTKLLTAAARCPAKLTVTHRTEPEAGRPETPLTTERNPAPENNDA